ncbi:InlB B-repeat-containing protein, partial [bacterium]
FSDPTGKGEVTISPNRDNYEHNESVQLTAEPITGYQFKCWGGSVNSTDNPLNISMIANKEIVAYFEPVQAWLHMKVEPNEGGVTIPSLGEHAYDIGTVVDIAADSHEGYQFVGWEGDVTDHLANPTTVIMGGNKTVWAVFQATQATLEMKINIEGAGETTPAIGTHTYEVGETVTVIAHPAEGYRFKCWEGDVEHPYAAETQITMEGNKIVKAFFELDQFELLMKVHPEGSGITVPSPGEHWYTNGTVVQIAADSHEGYQFKYWEGDVEDKYNIHTTVTMDGNKTVWAKFQSSQATLEMKINIEGAGTTTPAIGTHTYEVGETVTVIAHPAEGYQFKCWDGYVADPYSATTTITLPHDKTVVAHFKSINEGEVTLHLKAGEGGITLPQMGEHCFTVGTVVELEANPSEGFTFDHWQGPVADRYSTKTTVKMEESCIVKALFVTENVKLKMRVYPEEGGETSPEIGEHWMERGQTVDIQAIPNDGYSFKCWEGPVADVYNSSTTVIMDESHTVKATFTLEQSDDQVKLKMKANPAEGGSTTPELGEHLYTQGEVVNISAVPSEGYAFWCWDGPVADAESAGTTVTMNENCDVWAKFKKTAKDVTLTMRVKPDGAGDTSPALGEHTYEVGETIWIEAFANPGYTFRCWSGPVNDPYANPTSIIIQHNTEIKAVFNEPDTSPPVFSQLFPHPGSQSVPKNTKIQLKGKDNESGIDVASIQVRVNGEIIVQNGQDQTGGAVEINSQFYCFKLFYEPTEDFPEGSEVTVSAAFGNQADPQLMTDTTFTFTIGKTEIENQDGKEMGTEGGTVTHEQANVTITVPVEALEDT